MAMAHAKLLFLRSFQRICLHSAPNLVILSERSESKDPRLPLLLISFIRLKQIGLRSRSQAARPCL